ncbi:MAG: UvrD-helicase domain-containing protein [Acidobacteriota bacterium]
MSVELADEQARETVRTALGRTLVVEAAAGTGKTTALVGRIIQVIRSGRGELARLVAVTFTEKAAGELKLRLRTELENARRQAAPDPKTLERLEKGLSQLEEARIGTIHGFCADLLKERPLQARVDPLFEVATEDEARRLYRRVFNRWLEEKLNDPPPGIRRLLRHPANREEGPVERLERAGWELIDRRDFPARWEIRPFERETEIDGLVSRALHLHERSSGCPNPRDYLYRGFAGLRSFVAELTRQEKAAGQRDYDYLEHGLPSLRLGNWKGRGRYADGVSREELLEERDSLKEAFKGFRKRAGADLAAHLQNELAELIERYQIMKEKAGRLDFLDLLVGARDLLLHDVALRRELQERFTHIFVDEFQDTDPLQAEILLLLASDDPSVDDWRKVRPTPGKLFVVADPKQSIYRFRRADVALYHQIKKQLLEAGAELVFLSVSFRAVPEIQEMVNAAVSRVMTGSERAHQASYVPLERYRDSIEAQPAVVALPVPRPYSQWGNLANYAIEKSEPEAVAAWVKWLVEESGWMVTSRDRPAPRPLGPSDVCLLFRRFVSGNRAITQPYVDALQARDVPHVLMGGRGFHQREEIEVMRNALTAIERPDDELSVFATLRGPLFSLSDEALFLFRSRHGAFHPFRKLTRPLEGEDGDVAAALEVLARLHKGRNHRPIALTIRQVLDETRAQAGFALWQAGDQVLANVLRLLQLARDFEATGGLSFRGFVQHLEQLADKGETAEQPLIEEGVEGVRLMTVHRAKGLEFPVVVLCDITCPLGDAASRHIDPDRRLFVVRLAGGSPWELLDHQEVESEREAAESQRLLYVASTRARDLLVVPAVADEAREKSWVAALHPALYPEPRTSRLPVVAPGCPRFTGEDTVIDRPWKANKPPEAVIKPGQHKPQRGGHRVVWWDPELLIKPPLGKPAIRRHWILQAEEGAPQEADSLHEQWQTRRAELLGQGSRASLEVTTATRKAELDSTPPPEVRVERVERVRGRPLGKAFGTLVHEILATADLEAGRESLRSLAKTLGRILGNTDQEVEAATEAAFRALAHPLLRSAAAAARVGLCHRETPFIFPEREGGRLIEGVPDLVFRPSPEAPWTVVDFKTDVREDIGQEAYRRQLATYTEALRQATGSEAEGVLLYV